MAFFIRRNQTEYGPFSDAQVVEAMKAGEFVADDFARTSEMSEYKALGELLNGAAKAATVQANATAAANPPSVTKPHAVAQPRPVAQPRASGQVRTGAQPAKSTMPRNAGKPQVVGRRPIAMQPVVAPPKKSGGIVTMVVALAVLGGGLYVAYGPNAAEVRQYVMSLAGSKSQLFEQKDKAAAPVEPVVQQPPVSQTPEDLAAMEPQGESLPEVPQLPGFNPAVLANNPALWPKDVHLIEDTTFPAVVKGTVAGTVKVPAGVSVKLVKISGEVLTLDYMGGQARVSWTKTDLEDAAAEVAKLAAAQPPPLLPVDPPAAPPVARTSTYGSNYGSEPVDTTAMPERITYERMLRLADYKLTPDVQRAYFRFVKARTLRQVHNSKTLLSGNFLDWIDSDPTVAATVWGARKDAAGVLCVLRSLDLEFGEAAVRRDYTQLALAIAVVDAPNGASADLTPRKKPFQLTIPGDPRVPVDTHAKNRPLDVNDHIINFLEDHEPVLCEPFNVPEFKPMGRGVPIATNTKPKKVEQSGRVKRKIVAADVIASRALQEEFNAYMKAHGHDVQIDCGDKVLTQNQTAAVNGGYGAGIKAAYDLFRGAYEAKGRLPKGPDAAPTSAERFAYIMRNDSQFPGNRERQWNRFHSRLAPWPVMTLLAQSNMPLREREELFERFADRGEAITYGEYTGGIAQQADYQAARRLAPYPFYYSTFQMMLKDGGVCGTMANMAVRTHTALGAPSCTAGQPGHCALILFTKDKKSDYYCSGEQFVSGYETTNPHAKWSFGDIDAPRHVAWHMSVAYGVNAGFQSYLDSMVALQIYKDLPEDKRKEKGLELLKSGLSLNRYNIALLEAAAANPDYKGQMSSLCAFEEKLLNNHGNAASCPSKGFYTDAVKKLLGPAQDETPKPEEPQVTAREKREKDRKEREEKGKQNAADRDAASEAEKKQRAERREDKREKERAERENNSKAP